MSASSLPGSDGFVAAGDPVWVVARARESLRTALVTSDASALSTLDGFDLPMLAVSGISADPERAEFWSAVSAQLSLFADRDLFAQGIDAATFEEVAALLDDALAAFAVPDVDQAAALVLLAAWGVEAAARASLTPLTADVVLAVRGAVALLGTSPELLARAERAASAAVDAVPPA